MPKPVREEGKQPRLEYRPKIADVIATETGVQLAHQKCADHMGLNGEPAKR
jgi:hypothetical protein